MTKPFDMALFLSGVLNGSQATQQRHLRQARAMQAAIQQRWQRDNPWTWQLKHVRWFLTQHLKDHSDATWYYYQLTALLVWKRLGNSRKLLIGARLVIGRQPSSLTCPHSFISAWTFSCWMDLFEVHRRNGKNRPKAIT